MPTWSSYKKQNSSWRQLLLRNLMLPWSRNTCPKWNASSRSSPCWACMMRGWVTSPDTFASRWAPCKSGGNSNTYAPERVSGFSTLLSVWWRNRWKRSGGLASSDQLKTNGNWYLLRNQAKLTVVHWCHLASVLLQGLLQFCKWLWLLSLSCNQFFF